MATQGIALTAEMLGEVPPELLRDLDETTLALNREATFMVIDRIEEHEPDTAQGLSALVENFQIGSIRRPLGDANDL